MGLAALQLWHRATASQKAIQPAPFLRILTQANHRSVCPIWSPLGGNEAYAPWLMARWSSQPIEVFQNVYPAESQRPLS